MFIFTILLKKINEDIAQGTENYNEFSVVSRNLKSEFVKIKTVNVETGEEDFIHISLSFILFYAITIFNSTEIFPQSNQVIQECTQTKPMNKKNAQQANQITNQEKRDKV